MSITRKRVNASCVRRAIDLAEHGERPAAILRVEREIANAQKEVSNPPSVEDLRRIAELQLRLDALNEEWMAGQSSSKASEGT